MKRLLLIEDDTSAQLLYRNRLTELGFEVVVSSTGAMGLMEARNGPFDLFLVDIGLGSGIDGYDVCRRLKAIPEVRVVPVVLISGTVKTQEDLHRGYTAGCQSYLVKGDLTLLEDVVRAMLCIKSLQDDLALQNRLLEDQNRRMQVEKARAADDGHVPGENGSRPTHEPAPMRPDGILVVDDEGVVRMSDRGARELLGQGIEGKHLAQVAPDSRLEAVVRNARIESHEALRIDLGSRPGRAPRSLVVSVVPLVTPPDRIEPTPRLVLLYDSTRRRVVAEHDWHEGHGLPRREVGPLIEAARETFHPRAFLGRSPFARELRARLTRLARAGGPVLIRGPSGSGKGLVARILHFSGERGGPFLPVACGALEAEALEGELFGHPRSPLPGAPVEQHGVFHRAQNGTVYLQDVERLPLALQLRLVDVLRSGSAQPPGSGVADGGEVRILASARADLARSVAQGRFDGELQRRLAGEWIELPPLREHAEDVELLLDHFLGRFGRHAEARFSPEALAALLQHDWPENARELVQVVRHACEMAHDPVIGLEELPRELAEGRAQAGGANGIRAPLPAPREKTPPTGKGAEPSEGPGVLLQLYERRALLRSLELNDGDKLAAARYLGVGKSTFYRKLKLYGIT